MGDTTYAEVATLVRVIAGKRHALSEWKGVGMER